MALLGSSATHTHMQLNERSDKNKILKIYYKHNEANPSSNQTNAPQTG